MKTEELRRGNTVFYESRIIKIDNIHEKSVNVILMKTYDSKEHIIYKVKKWISIEKISPLPLNSSTLRRLGFRQETDTRFRIGRNNKTLFVIRHIDKYYLAVNNSFNEVAELKNIHHLQNLIYFWFDVDLIFR